MLERATHRPGASERWRPEPLCDTASKWSQSGGQSGCVSQAFLILDPKSQLGCAKGAWGQAGVRGPHQTRISSGSRGHELTRTLEPWNRPGMLDSKGALRPTASKERRKHPP